MTQVAVAGSGITMLVARPMCDHLTTGRLRRILPIWQAEAVPINIVYPIAGHTAVRTARRFERAPGGPAAEGLPP